MRSSRILVAVAALAFATAACADQTAEDDLGIPPATETTPPATPADADPLPELVAMQPVGESQLTGSVEIDGDDRIAGINVQINGSTDGAVHQGHIHTGTCDAPGTVVQPLEPITIEEGGEGSSENDVDLTTAAVTDGQHIVVYHEAGGNPGAPALCVAIPQRSGTDTGL